MEAFCRFGAGRAYHHQEHKRENSEMNTKVENLENTLNKMAAKIGEFKN